MPKEWYDHQILKIEKLVMKKKDSDDESSKSMSDDNSYFFWDEIDNEAMPTKSFNTNSDRTNNVTVTSANTTKDLFLPTKV